MSRGERIQYVSRKYDNEICNIQAASVSKISILLPVNTIRGFRSNESTDFALTKERNGRTCPPLPPPFDHRERTP